MRQCRTNGKTRLRCGRDNGHFDWTWFGAAGECSVDLAIADLDEGGLADLAVANHGTDHVTLLLGIAGGAFERRGHSRFRNLEGMQYDDWPVVRLIER